MTSPVNLYLLSRIKGKDSFNHVFHHAMKGQSQKQTPIHEIKSLRSFTDQMISCGVPVDALDGFFLGFSIPQIGKEFDLLKFRPDGCLNIELKSLPVPLEQIRTQLLRNRHYLGHLGVPMELFTFVSDTRQCFHLTEHDVLASATPSDIAKAVLSFQQDYLTEIDGMFRASEYIVSPSGTPEKFLNREYFLTQAQDQVRKDLLNGLGEVTGKAFFSLTGKPGTGKTLLLYDVGRTLSERARTAILHWGELTAGHEMINAAGIDLDILPWSVMDGNGDAGHADTASSGGGSEAGLPRLAPYSYILVDESHRLSPEQFRQICNTAKAYHQCVIFCLDPEQILTTVERRNNIAGLVAELPLSGAFTLSERLRGNRELSAFIQEVRDLNKRPHTHMDYKDVTLGYAATIAEAQNQLAYYRKRGFVFINYYKNAHPETGSDTAAGAGTGDGLIPDNPFADYEGGYDIHHVIGQEFDRVVMLLDRSFYYDEDGKLEGVPRPDPDYLYPNLFYQGGTRVQEQLALIVLENEPLFDRIAEILE